MLQCGSRQRGLQAHLSSPLREKPPRCAKPLGGSGKQPSSGEMVALCLGLGVRGVYVHQGRAHGGQEPTAAP